MATIWQIINFTLANAGQISSLKEDLMKTTHVKG